MSDQQQDQKPSQPPIPSDHMNWGLTLRHPSGAEFELNFQGSERHLNTLRSSLPPILNNASEVMMVQTHQQAVLNSLPSNIQPPPTHNILPSTHPTIPFDQTQIQGSPTVYQLPPAAPFHQYETPTVIQDPSLYYNPNDFTQLQAHSQLQSEPKPLTKVFDFAKTVLTDDSKKKNISLAANLVGWSAIALLIAANPTTRGILNGVPILNSVTAATDGLNPFHQLWKKPPTQPTPPPQAQPPSTPPPQGQPPGQPPMGGGPPPGMRPPQGR